MASNSGATTRPRSGTTQSVTSAAQNVRNVVDRILDTDVPMGAWTATANATATAPTLSDIRRGSFGPEGWNSENISDQGTQLQRQQSLRGGARRPSSTALPSNYGAGVRQQSIIGSIAEKPQTDIANDGAIAQSSAQGPREGAEEVEVSPASPEIQAASTDWATTGTENRYTAQPSSELNDLANVKSYPDGYIEAPKVPWTVSTKIGFLAFIKWFCTPFGFLLTIYGLNVVAWGGMLFLLLCNASPAMCSPNDAETNYDGCNYIDSPRRIWLEIDSQILNGLFCVTGFGLIPWRFRDLYWLLRWRFTSERRKGAAAKAYPLRRLAGIHNGWFRLPDSDTLDEIPSASYPGLLSQTTSSTSVALATVPTDAKTEPKDASTDVALETGDTYALLDPRIALPLSKAPAPPLTGVRAPPTTLWLLDLAVWSQCWNTFFQCCLCGFMWGLNRYDRPSWATGLFIGLACIIAGVGGIVMFKQGKKVKRVEGVAPAQVAGQTAAGGTAPGMETMVR